MKFTKIMPPTWMLVAIIAMLILNLLFPIAQIIPPLWNMTGLIFLASGMILNLIGDNAFKHARTTIKPFEESSNLVTDSVFQVSRNPMYLGMVLILTGTAILLRSFSPYLVIIAFVVFIDRTYVRVEEKMLAEKFGAVWVGYKSKTRRWL